MSISGTYIADATASTPRVTARLQFSTSRAEGNRNNEGYSIEAKLAPLTTSTYSMMFPTE
eukprot:CAMPEP_0181100650 /NCGR_PEP_ID=MMETSP1071-20121207/13308_1 /TAXON_ID=35127 /ORGANISM="Thalassiosira sp., Strain NH16" /LENGTH=59 /DNA_ID=CAMNT_0023183397 /DNA_START=452 /DNA_END=631 /DNA_ORIENTATION=+